MAITGEIDIATEPTVWSLVQQAMGDGASRLVLDLSRTTFMDSTGLSLIIRASGIYGSDAVVVRDPQPRVRQLFEVTGLSRHLTIEPSEPALGRPRETDAPDAAPSSDPPGHAPSA